MSDLQQKKRWLRLAGILILLFSGFWGPWEVQAQPAPDTLPDTVAKEKTRKEAVAKLKAQSKLIERSISKIRELPFKKPVKKGIQSPPELRDYLVDLMKKKQPPEQVRAMSKAYAMLRLIGREVDLEKVMLDLLEEQVAGFYDPEAKALFLIDRWSFTQTAILSHELTHALQDQYFDLSSLPLEDQSNDDLTLALRSVVEGEAMLVMMLHLSAKDDPGLGFMDRVVGKGFDLFLNELKHGASPGIDLSGDNLGGSLLGMDQLDSAPLLLKESLIVPYFHGLAFVHRAWHRNGWEGVNNLYQNLPQSSEQILHPKKFFREKDVPTKVNIPSPEKYSPNGFKLIYHTILGELYTSVLFRKNLKRWASRKAWEGWDGDQYLSYAHPEKPEKEFFIWATVWDSKGDAKEFEEAYQKMLRTSYASHLDPNRKQGEGNGSKENPQTSPFNHRLERKGNEVLVLGGSISKKHLEETASRVWKDRVLKEANPVRSKSAGP